MKKIFLLAATIFCFSNFINAQAGQLDRSFGNNGIVKTDIGAKFPYTRYARQILSLPDESMYVIEEFRGLSKRFSNGSLDSSFGVNGYAQSSVYQAALQSDGKIVALGNGELGRYNTNGLPDSSFSGDGKQAIKLEAYAVAIQKDGKIIIAGHSTDTLSLARYNTNGSPDSTFNGDGFVSSNRSYDNDLDYYTTAIAIQTDGKIVVAGGFPMVRYNADGTIDKTFSGNGIYAFQGFSSIAIQNDGRIVTVGLEVNIDEEGNTFITDTICRFNTDGSFDKSFSGDGKQPVAYQVASLALQSDGKIVTAGSESVKDSNGYDATNFVIGRYKTNGSLDSSFSNDGKQTTIFGKGSAAALTVVIQSDGKILAGGSAYYSEEIAIARYNTNGSLDKTFDGDGKLIVADMVGNTVYKSTAIQKDGKIVVAGSTYTGISSDYVLVIARYNTDGSLDNTFSNNGILITNITAYSYSAINIAVQSDGKIIAACEEVPGLVRYNADGSTDTAFHYNTDNKQTIRSLALQNDGKILAEGPALYGTYEVRSYNTNGSLDNAFGQNGIQTVIYNDKQGFEQVGSASSMAIQSDGKIVVGGVNNVGYSNVSVALFRLNTDGSLDNTFSNDGKVTFPLVGATSSLLAIQNDGRIIIGSDFADYNSSASGVFLKRFNTDGSIDNSFNGQNPLHHAIYSVDRTSIAIQNDNKIILGGSNLLRLNINGGVDSTFNINAVDEVDLNVQDIAISNNKLYTVGGGLYGIVARFLLDNKNIPPTVKITSPANNTVYAAPAIITINAAASDSDGIVTSVKFYNGSTYLKTDFTSPYSYTLTDLPAGTYTITAKATDNTGAQTVSAPVKVIVNKAPIVSITSPVNNASFTAPATITLNAAASDADGTIHSVKFYNGTTYLKAVFASPYTYTISNLPAGNYSLTVKATDNNGAQTISSAVTVTVKAPNKAPTVSITSPANNTTYAAPANITINALAADEDGTIHSVKFYNGTTYLKAVFASPYTYTLSNLPAGTYSITAKATDNDGAETISAPVTVTVSNAAIVSSRPVNNKTAVSEEISLKLYPNPATNLVNISYKGLQQDKQATISVISASGVVMKTMQSSSAAQMQLDVSSLARGVYTVKIVSGDKVMFKQFVKL